MAESKSESKRKAVQREKVEQAVADGDRSEFAQLTKAAERGVVYERDEDGDLKAV